MKKLKIILFLITAIVISESASAQVLSESAKRKVTVGVDLFSDILIYDKNSLFFPEDFS